jgi:hypothetical protein
MSVTKHTVTEEQTGFKIVSYNYDSLVPSDTTVHYAVGSTQHLGDDDVVPCRHGLHFCPRALDCLQFANVYNSDGSTVIHRLIRVVVPVGAVVATDDGGFKYAASALRVDADVTDDMAELLTGATTYRTMLSTNTQRHHFQAGKAHRVDGPATISRAGKGASMAWWRDGRPYNGYRGRYCAVSRDRHGEILVYGAALPTLSVRVVDAVLRREIDAMLDECELF